MGGPLWRYGTQEEGCLIIHSITQCMWTQLLLVAVAVVYITSGIQGCF
jgi:hypothetical protein